MKSKKKLLLLGVGAMGALAMGVGATSTFAWYQVTAAVTVTNQEATHSSFTVHEETLSAGQYLVDFTFEKAASTPLGTVDLHLSDNVGSTLYSGAYNSSTGGVRTATATAGDVLQAMQLKAAWHEGQVNAVDYDKPTTSDDIAYLQGKTLKGALLKASGNVRLVNTTANSSVTDYEQAYVKVTVDAGAQTLTVAGFYSDDALTQPITIQAVRISTNNKYGAEVASSTTTGYQVAAAYVENDFTAGNYAVGKAVYTSGNGAQNNETWYYVMSHAYDSGNSSYDSFAECFERTYLHGDDGLSVASGSLTVTA